MGPHPGQYPVPPLALQRKWPWLLRALGRAYLRGAGWRIEGEFPAATKNVTIVAPHTSNWDFTLGIAVVFAVGLRVAFLGKHTLFKPPFNGLVRWLGGIPVDRRVSHGVVGECVRAFRSAPALMLALAPEGTRKGPSQWKTGFYRIAEGAGVPIFGVAFDYGRHVVQLLPIFETTQDPVRDLEFLHSLFGPMRGLNQRPSAPMET